MYRTVHRINNKILNPKRLRVQVSWKDLEKNFTNKSVNLILIINLLAVNVQNGYFTAMTSCKKSCVHLFNLYEGLQLQLLLVDVSFSWGDSSSSFTAMRNIKSLHVPAGCSLPGDYTSLPSRKELDAPSAKPRTRKKVMREPAVSQSLHRTNLTDTHTHTQLQQIHKYTWVHSWYK